MTERDPINEQAQVLRDLVKERRPRSWASQVEQQADCSYFVVQWANFLEAAVIVNHLSKIVIQGDKEAVDGLREIVERAGLGEWIAGPV